MTSLRALAWTLGLLVGGQALAGGWVVEGVDRARILPPAGTVVEDYRNAGYRLRVEDGVALVEIETTPLGSQVPFSLGPEASEDEIAVLARALTAGARTRYGAVSRVLGWVAGSIDYRLDRSAAQDATAVLARRQAYCSGFAKLAVALLTAVDVPVREVAGYVATAGTGAGFSGFHRWIEVYYPDVGWVFSDPQVSHHYVAATYLRLASTRLEPALGTEALLLASEDRLVPLDLYPWAPPGVTARRNNGRQLAGALQVQVEGGVKGIAVLEGEGIRQTHNLVGGSSSFLGLAPGSYLLHLRLENGERLERQVSLEGRVKRALYFPKRSRRVEGTDQR